MADGVVDYEVVEQRCSGGGRGHASASAAELKRKLDLYCAAVAKSMMGAPDGASLVTHSNGIGHVDFGGKAANSGTSMEQSDRGSNLEVQIVPANAKKIRRLLLNRESARRSRKRKETHLRDLESQVSRLTCENASLLKCLADMTQKYKDATLDNRNLIVDVETMRAKVIVAEEATMRLTGITLLSSTSEILPRTITLSSSSDLASPAVGGWAQC